MIRPALALLCLAGSVSAQTIDDHAIVGTITFNGAPGTTGLFYVKLGPASQGGGKITPLVNLPAALSVSAPAFGGCFSVLRRPSDGTIFVGDGAGGPNGGGTLNVYILKVAGAVVVSFRTVPLGTVPSTPGQLRAVGGLALLPDGRVLVAAGGNLSGGPMANSPLAILDDRPATPTISPILLSSPLQTHFVYGVACAPDGRIGYVINQASLPVPSPGRLYSFPIDTTRQVAPVLLHRWSSTVQTKLVADREGVLYTTSVSLSTNPPRPTIEEIRVNNGNATVTSTPVSAPVAVGGAALERAEGRFVFVSMHLAAMSQGNSVFTSDRRGNLSLLAGPPAGGWAMPYAIDLDGVFEPYGQAAGQDRHWFAEFPNPGGLPVVGNTRFSLTLRSSTPPQTTLLAFGLQKANIPLMGTTVLLVPAIVLPLTHSTTTAFPLPIPNRPALRGARVFAQAVHIETAGWAATRGLDLYIR